MLRVFENKNSKAIIFILLSVFFTESMNAISKLLVQDYSVFQIIWLRYVIYFFILVSIFIPRKGITKTFYTSKIWFVLFISFCILINAILAVQSYKYMPLADVKAILLAHPLCVIILAYFVLGEKPQKHHLIALCVCFLTLFFVLSPFFEAIG